MSIFICIFYMTFLLSDASSLVVHYYCVLRTLANIIFNIFLCLFNFFYC